MLLVTPDRLDIDTSDAEEEVDQAVYQSIVGSLMYAAISTRSDIAFAVAALSRYNVKPYFVHLTAAKQVLRYLKATADAKLIFPSTTSTEASPLVGYTDSDFAGDRVRGNKKHGILTRRGGGFLREVRCRQR